MLFRSYNRCDESGEHCAEPDKETSIFPGYMGVGSEVQRIGPVADLMRELEKIKKYSPEPVK